MTGTIMEKQSQGSLPPKRKNDIQDIFPMIPRRRIGLSLIPKQTCYLKVAHHQESRQRESWNKGNSYINTKGRKLNHNTSASQLEKSTIDSEVRRTANWPSSSCGGRSFFSTFVTCARRGPLLTCWKNFCNESPSPWASPSTCSRLALFQLSLLIQKEMGGMTRIDQPPQKCYSLPSLSIQTRQLVSP